MIFAIVLAAGSGSRLTGAPTPKQYLTIAGVTLLQRVTATFINHPAIDRLIIVVPTSDILKVQAMFSQTFKPLLVVPGGATRQASSRAGISALAHLALPEDIILIHDAARVLVTPDIIDRAIASLEEADAATPVIMARDTLMKIKTESLIDSIIDRSAIVMAQTPQAFRYRVIKYAHDQTTETLATDDISLVLNQIKVHYFAGSPLNFKVTTAEDMSLLQALIEKESIS